MKKPYKIGLGVVVVVGTLLVLAVLLALLLFPAERIRELVENKTSEQLDMNVRIGDIGLSFAGIPSLKISDITLGTPQERLKPFITVESIKVRVNILKLLGKKVEIVSVELNSPSITYVMQEIESEIMEQAQTLPGEKGPPALPLPVTLRSVSIDDGSLELERPENNMRLSMEDINQRFSLDISSDFTALRSAGVLKVGDIALSTGDEEANILGITLLLQHEINGDLTSGDFSIQKAVLTVNDLPVTVTGTLENWTKSSFEATTGSIDVETFLRAIPSSLVPEKENLSGSGEFSLTVSGTGDTEPVVPVLAFNGGIDIDMADLSYTGFPGKIDKFETRLGFSEQDIAIEEVLVTTGSSQLRLSGNVSSYRTSPELSIVVQGGLNTDDVTGALPVFGDMNLKGLVTMDVRIQGSPENPAQLRTNGDASLSDFMFEYPKLLLNPTSINGSISITPAALTLEKLAITSGKSDFTFNGILSDYMKLAFPEENVEVAFSGILTSNVIDIQDLIFIDKETPTIKPWDLEGPIKSAPVPPMLSAEATVQLGSVLFGKLKSDSVRGRMTLKDGVFSMDDLNVAAYQGNLTGNTTVNFSDIEKVTYNGGFNLNGFESGAFISDFFNTDDFFRGKLSSSLKFSGAGLDSVSMLNNLTGDGTMKFENGEIDNWEFTKKLGAYLKFLDFSTLKFDTIVNSFTIKDRKLYTPDIAMRTAHGDILMNGSAGFDTSIDYIMTLKLNETASQKAVEQLSSLAQWLDSDPGAIELDVIAGGTLKAPVFKLDTSKAQQQLKDAVKEEIKEEITTKVQEFIEEKIQDEELQEKGRNLLKKLLR